MLQRLSRNGYGKHQVRMETLQKLASGACPSNPTERSSWYRKWGMLITFLLTAALILAFMCRSSSDSRRQELQAQLLLQSSPKESTLVQTASTSTRDPGFQDVGEAFRLWDQSVGCPRFRKKHQNATRSSVPRPGSLQDPNSPSCSKLQLMHVNIRVESWTWIPDNLENLYSCRCGMSCLWTKSRALADVPDALFYEWNKPPLERKRGDPLRVYIELEAEREKAPSQDIFVSYHRSSDVQATYSGALFHNSRSYFTSETKNKDVLVYWSSSRCLPQRQKIATEFLSLISHHSFGKCLNNVGEKDAALEMYPECRQPGQDKDWNQHLHCAMSHYKFALAIENTMTESYVTEKLFYALDSGTVPIYFGAPDVLDFVPLNSIILGTSFESMEKLARYVREVAEDPVRYAEFHAWRRCGVPGNYYWARALSLDSLPCRLCAHVSKLGGRSHS